MAWKHGDGLTIFQEMLGQTLKRASECRQAGEQMAVPFDDGGEDDPEGWQ